MSQLKEVEAIKKDLVSLERDTRQLAGTLGVRGKGILEGTGMKVWNTTKEWEKRAQEGIKGAYDAACKQGKRQIELSRKGISRYPLASVGSALLVGLLIGVVIGRLCQRED